MSKTINEALKDVFLELGGDPTSLSDNQTVSDYIEDLAEAIKSETGSVIDDTEASETKTYSSSKVDTLVEGVLPTVTATENGKVLGVSSGEWNAIKPPVDESLYISFGIWSGYTDIIVQESTYKKVRAYSTISIEDTGGSVTVLCHAYKVSGGTNFGFIGIVRGTGTTTYYTFDIDNFATGQAKNVTVTKVVVNDPA